MQENLHFHCFLGHRQDGPTLGKAKGLLSVKNLVIVSFLQQGGSPRCLGIVSLVFVLFSFLVLCFLVGG